jgi:hypothetical protein
MRMFSAMAVTAALIAGSAAAQGKIAIGYQYQEQYP